MEQITLHKQEGVEVPLNCKAPQKVRCFMGDFITLFFLCNFLDMI